MDVQEVRKLDAYLKRLFGNQRIRVVPKKNDSADVFVGEEAIGSLVLDEDEEDDERSYNFEVKITLGDATTTAPSTTTVLISWIVAATPDGTPSW